MNIDQLGANISCIPNTSLQEAIERIRDLGFHGVTLLAFANARHRFGDLPGFWFGQMSGSEQRELKESISGFDRRVLHAPFASLPVVSYDPKLEQLAHDRIQEAIDAAQYLGCQVVIVHANSKPNYSLPEYWDSLVAVFKSLGEYAGNRMVRLGLETGFPADVDQFIDLLEAIGHHAVGATLDCGHMLQYVDSDIWGTRAGAIQLNNRLMSMARQLGPLTIHVQLHDVKVPEWMDHKAIGRGVIDFEPFLAELQSLEYQGMLEFELEEKDAMTALKASKRKIEAILRHMGRQHRAA